MNIIKPFFLLSLFLIISCNTNKGKNAEQSNEKMEKFEPNKVLDLNISKVKLVAQSLSDSIRFPRNIPNNTTNWKLRSYKDWCSGFWPGVLWYSYEHSKEDYFKKQAEKFIAPLKKIAFSPAENHDIGFMIYCSYGNGYRLTGKEEYKKVLLAAADTLATLYNPNVGSILSWPSQKQYKHNTIVDNMMNLELLMRSIKP